jgi:hypothetical protein
MTHWVYGRAERPCRRCSTPVAFRDSITGTPYSGRPGGARTASRAVPDARAAADAAGPAAGVNEESFGSRTKRMSGARGSRGPRVPEGDTVWLAGQRLHEALAGDVLVRSDFRVPSLATVDLSGAGGAGGGAARQAPAAPGCRAG